MGWSKVYLEIKEEEKNQKEFMKEFKKNKEQLEKIKIALLNAMEFLQEVSNLPMFEIEKELGLPKNTYLELEREIK